MLQDIPLQQLDVRHSIERKRRDKKRFWSHEGKELFLQIRTRVQWRKICLRDTFQRQFRRPSSDSISNANQAETLIYIGRRGKSEIEHASALMGV